MPKHNTPGMGSYRVPWEQQYRELRKTIEKYIETDECFCVDPPERNYRGICDYCEVKRILADHTERG